MSEDYQTSIRLANKRFGEIVSDGFRLFTKTWPTLILPFAAIFIFSLVLKVFLFSDISWQINSMSSTINSILDRIYTDPNSITEADLNVMMQYLINSLGVLILQSIYGAIFTILIIYLVSNYLLKKYLGSETRFGEEVKNSLNKWLLLVLLILGLGIPLGSMLLFIPGLLIFGFYIFSVYTSHLSNEKPFKEARSLSKHAFWRIIGLIILVSLLTGVINFIYQLILDFTLPYNPLWEAPSTRNYGMLILYQIVSSIVSIIFAPLFISLLTPLFACQKAKKDYGLTKVYTQIPSETSYEQSYQEPSYQKSPVSPDSGLYCPFCGKFMKRKLKFCPSCGESLEFDI